MVNSIPGFFSVILSQKRKCKTGYTTCNKPWKGDARVAVIQMNLELWHTLTQGATPVVVAYCGSDCKYCRRIERAYEMLAQQVQAGLLVAKIDVDAEPTLTLQEEIEALPTLVVYQNGNAIGSAVAPECKDDILGFLRETLGDTFTLQ